MKSALQNAELPRIVTQACTVDTGVVMPAPRRVATARLSDTTKVTEFPINFVPLTLDTFAMMLAGESFTYTNSNGIIGMDHGSDIPRFQLLTQGIPQLHILHTPPGRSGHQHYRKLIRGGCLSGRERTISSVNLSIASRDGTLQGSEFGI